MLLKRSLLGIHAGRVYDSLGIDKYIRKCRGNRSRHVCQLIPRKKYLLQHLGEGEHGLVDREISEELSRTCELYDTVIYAFTDDLHIAGIVYSYL